MNSAVNNRGYQHISQDQSANGRGPLWLYSQQHDSGVLSELILHIRRQCDRLKNNPQKTTADVALLA